MSDRADPTAHASQTKWDFNAAGLAHESGGLQRPQVDFFNGSFQNGRSTTGKLTLQSQNVVERRVLRERQQQRIAVFAVGRVDHRLDGWLERHARVTRVAGRHRLAVAGEIGRPSEPRRSVKCIRRASRRRSSSVAPLVISAP